MYQQVRKINPQLYWHPDTQKQMKQDARRMGDEAVSYDRDGLMAVAHLGGVGGMKQFVRTSGEYNPSDALGTSLSDYYDKFSA